MADQPTPDFSQNQQYAPGFQPQQPIPGISSSFPQQQLSPFQQSPQIAQQADMIAVQSMVNSRTTMAIADVFGYKRNPKPDGVFSSEDSTLTVGDGTGASTPSLVQNWTVDYTQDVQELFEIGSNKLYWAKGRPVGRGGIGRIVGAGSQTESGRSDGGAWSNRHGQGRGPVLDVQGRFDRRRRRRMVGFDQGGRQRFAGHGGDAGRSRRQPESGE